MFFFIADEHFGHKNIIRYCNRPFSSVEEMNNEIIIRFNSVVSENDITVHAGDFTLIPNKEKVYKYFVSKLNGKHIFLKGSHDRWLTSKHPTRFDLTIDKNFIVVDHYAMRVWHRSHYNSWQLFGHSHGKLKGVGKQMDVGVDTNNFYPYSYDQIKEIMKTKEDNFNLVRK